MRLPYILVFVAILFVTSAFKEELQDNELFPEIVQKKVDLQEYLCPDGDCIQHRNKRSMFSALVTLLKFSWTASKVVLKVGHHTLLVGSFALTIINSATDGCATYPDICKNKDKVKKLEEECLELASQLMTKYDGLTEDYEMLRDVTLDNIYIDNILKGIADSVNEVFDMSEEVDNILNENIANTSLLSQNTAEEIVNILVPPVEYRLNSLQAMIDKTSKEGYIELGYHLAFLVGTEAIFSGMSKFSKTYTTVANLAGDGASFASKFKLTSSALWSKTTAFFSNFGTNVKKMITNKLGALKAKISNPKGAVKSYVSGINGAHTFANAMGAAAGAVLIYINDKHWKAVDKAVKQALSDYRQYKIDLQEQLDLANNQTETISDVKLESIETFNSMVDALASGINSTLYSGTELYETLQPDSLPDDVHTLITNEKATNNDILAKQDSFLQILNDTKFNLDNYYGWIKALNMVVTSLAQETRNDFPVVDILAQLLMAFQYQHDDVKQFSYLISLESLVCSLTFILPSDNSYRTFPLQSLRNICPNGIPDSFSASYIAEHEALAVDFITIEEVSKQKIAQTDTSADKCSPGWSPPQCIGDVHVINTAISDYFSKDPTLTAKSPPILKTVVYEIASLFSSDSTFAFIDLSKFRNGQTMTNTEFEDIMWDAEFDQDDCEYEAKRNARRECRSG